MSQLGEDDVPNLSESQVLALAEAADGVDWFAHQRTLTSLERRGLIRDGALTTAGHAALDAYKARWSGLFRVAPPVQTPDRPSAKEQP